MVCISESFEEIEETRCPAEAHLADQSHHQFLLGRHRSPPRAGRVAVLCRPGNDSYLQGHLGCRRPVLRTPHHRDRLATVLDPPTVGSKAFVLGLI